MHVGARLFGRSWTTIGSHQQAPPPFDDLTGPIVPIRDLAAHVFEQSTIGWWPFP